MKLPRFKRGGLCHTLEVWTIRSTMFHMVICILLAGIFFYLATQVNGGENSKSNSVLMGFGVLCCFPLAYTTLLLIGTFQNNILFLRISVIYGFIQAAVYSAIFLYVSILAFNTGTGEGLGILGSTILIAGYMIYNNLIVHSIYMNLKEKYSAINNVDTAQHI